MFRMPSAVHDSPGVRRASLMVVTVLVLSLGALPAAAGHWDDEDDDDWRGDHARGHQHGSACDDSHRGHDRHSRHFEVPTVIVRADVGLYEPYYHGRTWFGPHRHYHTAYYFPVLTERGWQPRPHFYCNGKLHERYIAYSGPRFGLSVRY